MILLSELSRRRIRSINKLVRVNRTEVVMVIRVDKEKGTVHTPVRYDILETTFFSIIRVYVLLHSLSRKSVMQF